MTCRQSHESIQPLECVFSDAFRASLCEIDKSRKIKRIKKKPIEWGTHPKNAIDLF